MLSSERKNGHRRDNPTKRCNKGLYSYLVQYLYEANPMLSGITVAKIQLRIFYGLISFLHQPY